MNIDRWQQIVEMVKTSFEVEEFDVEETDELGGTKIEYIIFNGPMGRLRLEFSTHPAIINTKTKYTKRIGADITIEHEYSPTETVSNLGIWRWDDFSEEWMPFEASMFK
jgi:hypothetical protein